MKNSKFFSVNRQVVLRLVVFAVAACFLTLFANAQDAVAQDNVAKTETKAKAAEEKYKPKTKAQLKRTLSAMQYYVTQREGTEKPHQNIYWDNKKEGTYHCICCDKPLFASETKYVSGTGWPSFYDPIAKDAVGTRKDWKLIYTRVEVHCKRCHAHLGHVFDDGPQPTGKRYCMNSASLKFVKKPKEQKAAIPVDTAK